ncbi:hypothetical protein AUEXF2481DRAFT_138126 [Aureobasidium subglaciale EXF-2481]|uniref:Uncharacterized protein n=1 Tax=Aureobasidium subglaciale (strain EXF-2481) TaxID=1043005 RepID=A0A074ZQ98_AURSE|nr:uncharacterized protein AUEXF2481DRAFT_138126 [Aureobasidium subglaciale EXF-2481]KER00477.1 hypothetical protein AUEXF2481DRAFT_138126 [Aureobasidium subglaciale EXF-2481]
MRNIIIITIITINYHIIVFIIIVLIIIVLIINLAMDISDGLEKMRAIEGETNVIHRQISHLKLRLKNLFT